MFEESKKPNPHLYVQRLDNESRLNIELEEMAFHQNKDILKDIRALKAKLTALEDKVLDLVS